jgi:hypothetical protein
MVRAVGANRPPLSRCISIQRDPCISGDGLAIVHADAGLISLSQAGRVLCALTFKLAVALSGGIVLSLRRTGRFVFAAGGFPRHSANGCGPPSGPVPTIRTASRATPGSASPLRASRGLFRKVVSAGWGSGAGFKRGREAVPTRCSASMRSRIGRSAALMVFRWMVILPDIRKNSKE